MSPGGAVQSAKDGGGAGCTVRPTPRRWDGVATVLSRASAAIGMELGLRSFGILFLSL